jgi:hypothetical protein
LIAAGAKPQKIAFLYLRKIRDINQVLNQPANIFLRIDQSAGTGGNTGPALIADI